jgi:DUF2934 family protein
MSATAETSRRRRSDNLSIVNPERDSPMSSISREDIEKRAYQRFVERGSLDGGDIDDWLEAERELLANASSVPES